MKSKFPKKLLACLFKLAGIYYALYIGVWTWESIISMRRYRNFLREI